MFMREKFASAVFPVTTVARIFLRPDAALTINVVYDNRFPRCPTKN